ncbi:MAG: radical SAM protein [Clostridia bacterium]|nr:radical SAM protein [Clostridia bacterium]
MIEYRPWSTEVLYTSIKDQKKGLIPTLDIELTAKCSGACCIYCDSKPDVCASGQSNEVDFNSMKNMLKDAIDNGLKWVYTCGLGEPLEDEKFWNMIHMLSASGVSLSMFSNGVFIKDVNIARELKENNVNIILKMDTFNENNFDTILGGKGIAKRIYSARDYLLEAGYGEKNGFTDLAFSIVPTSFSIDGISDVVKFCKKYGVFASIGELEQAGEVINNNLNDKLSISKKDVLNLKKIADAYIEGEYMRPICPCILTGLHIDNTGNCVVDRNTGLNCKWFLLKDPETIKLGNINNESILELFDKVNKYRNNCFKNNYDIIKKSCDVSYVFGGCGGNPRDIIKLVEEQYV